VTDAPLSTRVIRAGFVSADDAPTVAELGRQFDRWLAGVKVEAARDALIAAAVEVEPDSSVDPETVTTIYDPYDVGEWLRLRALSASATPETE
jgi:hypothetical protein